MKHTLMIVFNLLHNSINDLPIQLSYVIHAFVPYKILVRNHSNVKIFMFLEISQNNEHQNIEFTWRVLHISSNM